MYSIYAGMTVNERLYVSGLITKFDEAVAERNVDAITQILREVEITDDSSVKAILKVVLNES